MKDDVEIVTYLNGCINLLALSRGLTIDEWNRLAELVEEHRLHFSGEPSGFHLKPEDLDLDYVDDCAHPLTSLLWDDLKVDE